jgi:hypothetical protein
MSDEKVLQFKRPQRREDPTAESGTLLRESIGAVLREERVVQQRSLADVAALASISLAYLSEVERGRKDVSAELLIAISRSLGLDGADVLERSARRLRTVTQRAGMQSRGSGVQMRAA